MKDAVELIRDKIGGLILAEEVIDDRTFLIEVKLEGLPKAVLAALEAGGRYSTMAGVDARELYGAFLVDYGITFPGKGILIVRAKTEREFPSVAKYVPAANWYEREVMDLLGLIPEGHPDPRRLVLPDGWPEGLYPLRKDFKHDYRPELAEEEYPFMSPEKKISIIPFGPFHFALHEPLHFRFFVEGEKIVGVDYRGFFVHRGIEKLAESKRMSYEKIPFLAERICGICGFVHSECYIQAVERAAKVDVPERAKYIRTILLEIERVHSHLLWLGVACHLVGFDTGFMQFWRVREKIMWLAEMITGSRKTYGMMRIGGVRRDISEDVRKRALEIIAEVSKEYKSLVAKSTKIWSFLRRLEGIGYLSKEDALKYYVVGPVARASGIKVDVRKDFPYEAYKELSFDVPVMDEGDVLARTIVRIKEVSESFSIIEQALDAMPEGDIVDMPDYIPPYKLSIGIAEAPRGEDIHYLITGPENTVFRWRVRAPTYANLQAVPLMLVGHTLADAPIIIGSIDPCISCTERAVVIDIKTGRIRPFRQEVMS